MKGMNAFQYVNARSFQHASQSLAGEENEAPCSEHVPLVTVLEELIDESSVGGAVFDLGSASFDLTAKIVDWEVEPGKVVQVWTYNGTVPAPETHVEVGDKVRVVLHNELPVGTVIHWHGIRVPNSMDGVPPFTQPAVMPGESFTYEFEALEPAVGIYHSHPRSPADPSQTDINLATYPHWRCLIVSLENEPVVRVWRIADGRVEEEELDVVDS